MYTSATLCDILSFMMFGKKKKNQNNIVSETAEASEVVAEAAESAAAEAPAAAESNEPVTEPATEHATEPAPEAEATSAAPSATDPPATEATAEATEVVAEATEAVAEAIEAPAAETPTPEEQPAEDTGRKSRKKKRKSKDTKDEPGPAGTEADTEAGTKADTKADTKSDKARARKKKKRQKTLKYFLIGFVVVVIAVSTVTFMRTKLLTTQLDMAKNYMDNEQWDEAEAAYNQALRIFHNSADAYLGLAEVSIGRGELTEAIRILEDGIATTHSANLEKSRDVIMDQVFATYVLDSYLVNILPDETAKLPVEHRSEDMNFSVTWSSADESIGTVDEDGNIKAIKEGTTKIIANIGNETWGYRDVSATLIVGVIVTYLEEQGCDYVSTPTGMMAPCFVYQQNDDGYRIYDGTLEIEQGNATYNLTKCRRSDPDPEGYVTYDIEYKINAPTKFGIITDSKEAKHEWYYNQVAEEMLLCDDYTGLIFSVQDLYGQEGLIYDSTVEWNDMEYHITGTTESMWSNDEDNENRVEENWAVTFSPLTSTTWAEAVAVDTVKITARVPAEYEGLCLALDKHGITDYKDPDVEDEEYEYDAAQTFTDRHFFEPEEDGTVRKPEDYYIVRLRDFIDK